MDDDDNNPFAELSRKLREMEKKNEARNNATEKLTHAALFGEHFEDTLVDIRKAFIRETMRSVTHYVFLVCDDSHPRYADAVRALGACMTAMFDCLDKRVKDSGGVQPQKLLFTLMPVPVANWDAVR